VSINPALVPLITSDGTWQAIDGAHAVWAQVATEDDAWDFISQAEAHTDIADWSVREV
jgi:hypothetical protein